MNAKTSADLFKIPEQEFVKAALKQPSLFYQKPETLKMNVKTSADLFKISEQEFVKAALRQSQLFYQKPETLKMNIKTSADLFKIPEQEFVKAALRQSPLFFQKPETLKYNISQVAKMLGIKQENVISLAKTYPPIFCLKPETTVKKVKLIQYYKKLQGKDNNKLSFRMVSNESIFKDILVCLLKQSSGNKSINSKNFIDYIISNPDKVFEFKLLESEYNKEFIEFVKRIFIQNTKKCNVKFIL